MKTSNVILIALLFLIIGVAISYWYIKNKSTCYDLPEHGSPNQWGRKYWFALHDVSNRVPCSICRSEATSFMEFFHDFVNLKTDKPLWSEQNFSAWLNKLSELKAKRDSGISQ